MADARSGHRREAGAAGIPRWCGLGALVLGALGTWSVELSGSIHDPAPRRLTHDGLDKQRPIWLPDGRLSFARHETGGTKIFQYIMDADRPDGMKRITARETPEFNAAVSPDGKRMLIGVVSFSGMQGNLDIAAMGLEGSDVKTVAGDPEGKLAHQDWPSWSPDGERFAFSSTHEGNQEIYTAKPDGTDVVRLTQHPGHDAHPCWSPDGRSIAFATDRWGGLELASVRPDGTGLARITDSRGLDDYPAYAPSGAKLAWVSNRDGQLEIYVAEADGSNPVNLTDHPGRDTFPTWTRDGRGVTFVSERNGQIDIYSCEVGR